LARRRKRGLVIEYPPSQYPASFTIEQAMKKLKQQIGD
jgi:hypothetical protein